MRMRMRKRMRECSAKRDDGSYDGCPTTHGCCVSVSVMNGEHQSRDREREPESQLDVITSSPHPPLLSHNEAETLDPKCGHEMSDVKKERLDRVDTRTVSSCTAVYAPAGSQSTQGH